MCFPLLQNSVFWYYRLVFCGTIKHDFECVPAACCSLPACLPARCLLPLCLPFPLVPALAAVPPDPAFPALPGPDLPGTPPCPPVYHPSFPHSRPSQPFSSRHSKLAQKALKPFYKPSQEAVYTFSDHPKDLHIWPDSQDAMRTFTIFFRQPRRTWDDRHLDVSFRL